MIKDTIPMYFNTVSRPPTTPLYPLFTSLHDHHSSQCHGHPSATIGKQSRSCVSNSNSFKMANDHLIITWNNYSSELQNVFCKLLESQQFVDVTLTCEGQSIKCHRLILSACSPYFERILRDNPSSNLVIFLKDMKFWELRALVTFMYNGEVSISQQKLPNLCKAAEALSVKGLASDSGLTEGVMDSMGDGNENDNNQETVTDSSVNDDTTCNNLEKANCGMEIAMRYGLDVWESALSGLKSGMTLRQCSETYGINKKTLSKIKSRLLDQMKMDGEEDSDCTLSPNRDKEDGMSGIVFPPKTAMGPPLDRTERYKRLKRAAVLALSAGITVRQAAAHFEIPRTTLCAYMKRYGLKRKFLLANSLKAANNTAKRVPDKLESTAVASADTSEQRGGGGNASDFPFLDISELMEDMGQTSYEEGSVEGEEYCVK